MPPSITPTEGPNGWKSWGNHVLVELERNEAAHKEIILRLNSIENSIVELKVKSGVWGMLGGAIPVAIGLAIYLVKSIGS